MESLVLVTWCFFLLMLGFNGGGWNVVNLVVLMFIKGRWKHAQVLHRRRTRSQDHPDRRARDESLFHRIRYYSSRCRARKERSRIGLLQKPADGWASKKRQLATSNGVHPASIAGTRRRWCGMVGVFIEAGDSRASGKRSRSPLSSPSTVRAGSWWRASGWVSQGGARFGPASIGGGRVCSEGCRGSVRRDESPGCVD
ncbi:hypothetical protein Droror1_Dr00011825 [Drosera rotundifolia]